MKYHFIYPDINTNYFPSVHHGIAQLFSVLKKVKHEVSLSHITKTPSKNEIHSIIQKENPDYICFTSMSNQVQYVKQWSKWIKERFDKPIICGGVHATLSPEDLLNEYIDYVCVGEGEYPLVENSFWHKVNGEIVEGKSYPYISNLDASPFPDYSLFDVDKILKRQNGRFPIIVSRGCVYNCYYCSNHALKTKQDGLYFRYRSVDNVIAQLGLLLSNYPIIGFSFADDIFGVSKGWMYEFCDKYPKFINRPFDCNLRVEMVSDELLKTLKSAGCDKVEMGIESGNEWIRENMLNRKMSNTQIRNAFFLAHKIGLKTRSYNMVGLPCDTIDTIQETIELNKDAKPNEVAVFYYYPFKGTSLYDVCKEKGYLTEKQATSYVTESVLNLPTITQKELKIIYNDFNRFAIKQHIKHSFVMRNLYKVVSPILKLVTFGNDVNIVRGVYQWLKS